MKGRLKKESRGGEVENGVENGGREKGEAKKGERDGWKGVFAKGLVKLTGAGMQARKLSSCSCSWESCTCIPWACWCLTRRTRCLGRKSRSPGFLESLAQQEKPKECRKETWNLRTKAS